MNHNTVVRAARVRPRLGSLLALAAALVAAPGGCSDTGPVGPVDQKAALGKVSDAGQAKARQSAKAKAADEEAAKTHPKLH
jgi:hypothetical protein